MIYIVTLKNESLKNILGNIIGKGWLHIISSIPIKENVRTDDQIYLNISGLEDQALKKAIVLLKKNTAFWGIIDLKGKIEDPASLFFEGASDYIGPLTAKKGLTKKRFEAAYTWFSSGPKIITADIDDKPKRKTQLSNSKFEGWKSIRAGLTNPFFFLFVSLAGKSNLRTLLGEAAFDTVKNRLRDVLQRELSGADALHWMETEGNSLFLIPAKKENGLAVIVSVMKMLINNRVISIEDLGLSINVDFTFALHYGQTIFQAPGKTGAVISETVNYIFHLGTKKAETGRLTISENIPEEVIPEGLNDLFVDAGIFESIPVRHSKRFIYS